ncbi:hypothetical protein HUU40_13450 [candidate division KSB1 bacterium]|nr:hypothetical protein [candidate division KSB1 bacterium]
MNAKLLNLSPDNSQAADNEKSSSRARLDEKIAQWRKYSTAAVFLFLGLLGLFLPVIPGLLFLGAAFWLVFPKQAEKIWGNLKRKLGRE